MTKTFSYSICRQHQSLRWSLRFCRGYNFRTWGITQDSGYWNKISTRHSFNCYHLRQWHQRCFGFGTLLSNWTIPNGKKSFLQLYRKPRKWKHSLCCRYWLSRRTNGLHYQIKAYWKYWLHLAPGWSVGIGWKCLQGIIDLEL